MNIKEASVDELLEELNEREELGKALKIFSDDDILDAVCDRGLKRESDCDREHFDEGCDEPHADPRMVDSAYLAMTPSTPEAIRRLILELADRIA